MTRTEILSMARRGRGRARASRCWTCAAAWPGPVAWSRRSWAAPTAASTGSAGAIEVARGRAAGLGCRFEVARGPAGPGQGRRRGPPPGDDARLPRTRSRCSARSPRRSSPGGRFAFTVEEGAPLTAAERAGDARRRHRVAGPAGRAARPADGTRAWTCAGCRTGPARTSGSPTALVAQPRGRAVGDRRRARRRTSSTTSSRRTGSGATGWRSGRVRKLAIVAEKHAGR